MKSFSYGKFLINKFFTFVAKQSGARNEKSMKTRKVRLPYYGKMHCARGHRQVVRQWLPKPSSAGSNPVARSMDILSPSGLFLWTSLEFGVVGTAVRVELVREYFVRCVTLFERI